MSIAFVCFYPMLFLISCSKAYDQEDVIYQNAKNEMQNVSFIGSSISFATGQASLLLTHLNGQAQHFSFHVVKETNGIVKGTWESKSPGQDLRTHGILNCLTFLDNNTAFMTGVVTQKVGDVFLVSMKWGCLYGLKSGIMVRATQSQMSLQIITHCRELIV
jgi:hypothetical protein